MWDILSQMIDWWEDLDTFHPPIVSRLFRVKGEFIQRKYNLSFYGRIHMTFDNAVSCRVAVILGLFFQLSNIASPVIDLLAMSSPFRYQPDTCTNPVCSNDPSLCPGRMVCKPIPYPIFGILDAALLSFLSLDFFVRFLTCWSAPPSLIGIRPIDWDEREEKEEKKESRPVASEPIYSVTEVYIRYTLQPLTLVDIASIFPALIAMIAQLDSGQAMFIRVIRLVRILKFNRSHNATATILQDAIVESIPAMFFVISLTVVFLIVTGCILNEVEGGHFDVTTDYPSGMYYRIDKFGSNTEVTPFNSVASAIYASGITLTTVGYGDLYPTTVGGRFVVGCMAYMGTLLVAIPAAVLSNKFTEGYTKYLQQELTTIEAERRRDQTIRRVIQNMRTKKDAKVVNENFFGVSRKPSSSHSPTSPFTPSFRFVKKKKSRTKQHEEEAAEPFRQLVIRYHASKSSSFEDSLNHHCGSIFTLPYPPMHSVHEVDHHSVLLSRPPPSLGTTLFQNFFPSTLPPELMRPISTRHVGTPNEYETEDSPTQDQRMLRPLSLPPCHDLNMSLLSFLNEPQQQSEEADASPEDMLGFLSRYQSRANHEYQCLRQYTQAQKRYVITIRNKLATLISLEVDPPSPFPLPVSSENECCGSFEVGI